jgi:DNA invertase Pin-like site-specific DNA recombinase
MKRVIELLRVSTAGQAENDRAGLPAQRDANRRTANIFGLEIVRTISIADVSGTAVLRSPEMAELLRLIESPDIVGVVAREFSRLMRPENFADYSLLQHFVDTKTVLYLPDGPIDLSSSNGNLLGGIRALMAGHERREILGRMMGAKEQMRRAGRHPGGRVTLPFGVLYDKKANVWSYTPEAAKIKQAYHLVLTTDRPFARIADELNINRTSISVMLRNPIYKGLKIYDKKRDPSAAGYIPGPNGRQGYRRKINREPDEVIAVRVIEDGLVSDEEFDAVQEILRSRAAREWAVRSKNAPKYTYNGFVFCGICSDPMYCHSNQKASHYYCRKNNTRWRCKGMGCTNPYTLAPKVEAKIEELLTVRFQDKSVLASISAEFDRQCADVNQSIIGDLDSGALQRQIEQLQAKRKRVIDSFIDGAIDKFERDERTEKIDAELLTYRAMLQRGEGPKQRSVTVETLAQLLSIFLELSFLSRNEKRQLMGAANARIYLAGYTIKRLEMGVAAANGGYPHLLPSSRGWRMTSSTFRGNSGNSSRNNTPL